MTFIILYQVTGLIITCIYCLSYVQGTELVITCTAMSMDDADFDIAITRTSNPPEAMNRSCHHH